MKVPVRTCIGCRTARPWTALVRVARHDDATLLLAPRVPGRGAWLCAGEAAGLPDADCFEQAAHRQAFRRAFQAPVTVDAVNALRRTIQERARIEIGVAAGEATRRD